MSTLVIRPVERFAEPEFGLLHQAVFADIQHISQEWADLYASEEVNAPPVQDPMSPMHRLGAYLDDELVGWSCGWMERSRCYYMANSGVVQAHQRKGIYTALLGEARRMAESLGATTIRSRHSVLNNPVLIAKLRFGFQISGLSMPAGMGSLVELSYHLNPARQKLYRQRAIAFGSPAPTKADTPPASAGAAR